MARNTFQRGFIQWRKRKNGQKVAVLRYRVRDTHAETGWKEKTEVLPGCTTEKEALEAASRKMLEINEANSGRGTSRTSTTFAEFVKNDWSDYLSNRETKASTAYSYSSMLRTHVLPEFGRRDLESITPGDIARFLKRFKKNGYAPKYVVNLYALLSLMFDIAVENELIDSSPVRRRLHRPQHRKPKEKPALSVDEVKAILENVAVEYWVLCVLLSVTILRIGELLALKWSNVDFNKRTLEIEHNLWRGELNTPKTEESQKTYRLPAGVFDLLRIHHERSNWKAADDFVFCKADGSPLDPDWLRKKVLYPAMDAANIKRSKRTHGFHILRHSGASILYGQTRDLKLVQKQLRHSRIETTGNIYVHVDDSIAEEASEILSHELIPEFCGLFVAATSDQVQ